MEYESHEAMKDSTAYMITDMLKGTFQPYGSADYINMNGLNIAGKTGTTSYSESMLAEYNLPSNAAKDAWIVGYTPEYTMSVWTGFTSTKKDGATSFVGTQEHITPQWFFQNIMTQISTYNGQDFTMPESVTWVGGQELGVVNSSFQFNPNRIRRYYYEAPEEETEVEEDNTDEEVIDETEPEEPVETPENGDDSSTDNSDTTNPDTDSGE